MCWKTVGYIWLAEAALCLGLGQMVVAGILACCGIILIIPGSQPTSNDDQP